MNHPRLSARLALALLAASTGAAAQTVPQNHIPSPVLLEVRALERQFDAVLSADCAPELCAAKGCSYLDHVSVDLPRNGSLPGLSTDQGPGSVPPQEYLTEARCQLTHEKSVSAKDVVALTRRLEQRLSKAWLKVTVNAELLEPIPAALRRSPEDTPPPPPPVPEKEPPEQDKPDVPAPPWDPQLALRELWLTLLPHFAWMIAVVMLTIATLMLIWAGRRLGSETIEEKMLAAQMSNPAEAEKPEPTTAAAPSVAPVEETPDQEAFAKEQETLWSNRVTEADLAGDDSVILGLLREWLNAGEYPMLAKAVFIFGDRLLHAFATDPELAAKKVELAEYLRIVDEKTLPTRLEFFRRLNREAIASLLLAQSDVQIYRSLREEFGATGILRLMEALQPRQGSLLFALVPTDCQSDIAQIMTPPQRVAIADQLLSSTRISRDETDYIFSVLDAARHGKELPPVPTTERSLDRGRELDAPAALSTLLPRIASEQRQALFAKGIIRSGGSTPHWYENILYGDILLRIPEEQRRDILLEVDVRELAAWVSLQDFDWQRTFLSSLAAPMQAALKASTTFASRSDQLRMARRGHLGIVAILKKQMARGRLSFHDLIA